MPNTKPDKYDEAAEKIQALYHQGVYAGDTEKISAILHSIFPPPAEEARQLIKSICLAWCDMPIDADKQWDYAAAEIESFAQSRVEPWREGVRAALEYSGNHWSEWGERAERVGEMLDALLSDYPAKKATKVDDRVSVSPCTICGEREHHRPDCLVMITRNQRSATT